MREMKTAFKQVIGAEELPRKQSAGSPLPPLACKSKNNKKPTNFQAVQVKLSKKRRNDKKKSKINNNLEWRVVARLLFGDKETWPRHWQNQDCLG